MSLLCLFCCVTDILTSLWIVKNSVIEFLVWSLPSDLEGRISCFPTHDGAAFTAVTESLNKLNLTSSHCSIDTRNFFSRNSCFGDSKSKYCENSDEGAFKCLNEIGDVAFMSLETFKNLTGNERFTFSFFPIKHFYFFFQSKLITIQPKWLQSSLSLQTINSVY